MLTSFNKIILLLLVLFAGNMALAQENCANGVDDDGDGLVDCLDPDCTSSSVPTGAQFNTATNGSGGVLPGGSNDNNWQVCTGSMAGPYVPATVMSSTPGSYYNSPWPSCDWISHNSTGSHGGNTDFYYRIQFLLPCVNSCGASYSTAGTFCLYMDFFCDNSVDEVYINGVPQSAVLPGVPAASPYGNVGFSAAGGLSFSLCSGWQPGLNTLIIKVSSGGPYAGFLAQYSTSAPVTTGDPTISPMPTYTYCPTDAPVDFNGVTSGGTWSATCGTCINTTTGVFDPAVGPGTYTIYHEVNVPCYAIDSVDVTVSSPYDATITPAGPFCANDATVTLTAADPGGTWSASCGACVNAATGVFDPALASIGANTVTYTISAACGVSDNETITVKAVPDVTGTATTDLCSGQTTSIALSSSLAGTTFAWTVNPTDVSGASDDNGSTIAQTLTTTGPGNGSVIYTITPTADGCTGAPHNLLVNVIDLSINDIAVTDARCAGSTDGTITIDAPGAVQYSIDGGTTFQASNAFATGAGTYAVVVENNIGCQATQNVTIAEPAALTLPTSFTNETCFGSCDGIAGTAPVGGTAPYTYDWGPSFPTNPFINGLCDGTYTVTVTDDHNCQNSASVTITGPIAVDITNLVYTQPTCNGYNDGSIDVTATTTSTIEYSSDGGLSFQAGNIFTGIPAGTYTIVVQDSMGCRDQQNIVVDQPSAVSVSSSPDVTICTGQTTTFSASATGGTSPYTYTWDNGLPTGPTHTVSPTTTTVYNVSVTDDKGCGPALEFVTVTVRPPLSVTASPDQVICPGTSTSISALGSGGNGGPYTYTWTNDQAPGSATGQTQVVSPNSVTTYTVTVSDGCTNPTSTDLVVVDLFALPSMQFTVDTVSGCAPLIVHFTNTTGATASCAWDFGDGSTANNCDLDHVYTEPGCYDVLLTITTADGCTKDTTVNDQVCVYAMPVAGFTFGPQPTDILEPEILFTNLTIGASVYEWDFAGLGLSEQVNPSFVFPNDSGAHYQVCLTATSSFGCMDDICHEVIIMDQDLLYVPNAFTPDGDGMNDIFAAYGKSILTFELRVFNRWGQVVFFSNEIRKGWDGTHNGIRSKEDTYVWQVKYSSLLNPADVKTRTGHVTLLR